MTLKKQISLNSAPAALTPAELAMVRADLGLGSAALLSADELVVAAAQTVTVAAPATVAAGDLVVIGEIVGVAKAAADAGAPVSLRQQGSFQLPALTAGVWAAGAPLYWDATNKRLTSIAASHRLVGPAVDPKAAGVATAVVLLWPTSITAAVAQAARSLTTSEVAVRLGLVGPVYVNRSDTDKFTVNGAVFDYSRPTMSFQDLFWTDGSLRFPLVGKANIETANVGQALVPIPGATSAPYWTDPGSVTVSRTADTVTDQIAPFIVWNADVKTWTFRAPPGYGAAAAGKRRAQIFFDKVRPRRRVVWDLSFRLPEEDDLPYSASPAYKYPMLIWQFKGTDNPFAGMTVESVGDGTANLFWAQKWSSDSSDVSTYRRQFNAGNTGNITAQSQSQRLFNYVFQKGQWLDILIESYLDERDVTSAAGGFGYTNVWINGVQVLCYSGPTLAYRDVAGATPEPHQWMVGVYRHESGVPASIKELDLTRPVDPAPFNRATEWRRAKLMDLGVAFP